MLKKIYISFNNISKLEEEEIKKLSYLLLEKDTNIIWQQKFNGEINYATTLEIYFLICTLRNKGYNDIELLLNPSLFIHNDNLFIISDNSIKKLDTDGIGFFSVRGYNWNHPFFIILKNLIENKGGILTKTNFGEISINDNGKFRPLIGLYKKRKKFIGDIIIPYGLQKKDYILFKKFIQEKIGEKIVIKRSMGEYGKEVFMIDLLNYNTIQEKKFTNSLNYHLDLGKEIYIVPFKTFLNEYRVYFTNFNNNPKIYSIKIKNMKIDTGNIFEKENFYYKGLFDWTDVKNSEYKSKYKYIVNFSKKYLKYIDYTAGVLEFGEMVDGGFMLFEVNHMAASLCTTIEDSENMTKYYNTIFKNYLL